jgi:signal transduction histidine kinase
MPREPAPAHPGGPRDERHREAEIWSRLARDISESLELDIVLQRVADAARELCRADVARIALRRPDTGALTFHYWAGHVLDPTHQGFVIQPGQGVGGHVLVTGRPFRTDRYTSDPRITGHFLDVVVAEGIVAVMAVPISAHSRLEGVLFVDNRTPRAFSDEDEAVLCRLADHAAIAIRNARMYGDLQATMATLEASQRRAAETERLRALGTLASGMAHHLNNLLAVMLGRVEMIMHKVADPEVARQLETVRRAGLDGAEIVRRVMRFAQVHPPAESEPVDLNVLIADVVGLARPEWQAAAAARGTTIGVSVAPGLIPLVMGDSFALREALMSVLLNAIDAMPDGGKISLRTWAAEEKVWCTLTDTGVGMSDDTRRQILDPFFTTKGPRRTGLGLSAAYGILQRHGGGLAIESAEGAGTTVVLHLPAAARDDRGPSPG